jgi:hypothetical protein
MTVPSPLADACPRCFPDAEAAVLPVSEPVLDRGSLRAHYRHDACGSEWDCWFDPEASGWALIHSQEQVAS